MALKSAADVVLRMQKMEKAVGPAGTRKALSAVGLALKPVALGAAASTKLGSDLMFTRGWSSAGPLQVAFSLHRDGMGLTMHRRGRSAGPWRVAESGRVAGVKGELRETGRISKKTGKALTRAVRRTGGATAGFGAWSKAEAAMGVKARPLLTKLEKKGVADAFLGR